MVPPRLMTQSNPKLHMVKRTYSQKLSSDLHTCCDWYIEQVWANPPTHFFSFCCLKYFISQGDCGSPAGLPWVSPQASFLSEALPMSGGCHTPCWVPSCRHLHLHLLPGVPFGTELSALDPQEASVHCSSSVPRSALEHLTCSVGTSEDTRKLRSQIRCFLLEPRSPRSCSLPSG